MNIGRFRLTVTEPSALTARFARLLTITMIVTSGIALGPTLLVGLDQGIWFGMIANVAIVLLATFFLALLDRGYVRAVTAGLLIIFIFGATSNNVASALNAILALITAASLGNTLVFVLVNYAVLLIVSIDAINFAAQNPTTEIITSQAIYDYTFPLLFFAALSLLTRYFINSARAAAENAKQSVDLLQASAEIGQLSSRLLDIKELMTQTVNAIAERFKFYNVRLYLLNEAGNLLELAADSGETRLQNHRLFAVGDRSLIGQVSLRRRFSIVRSSDPGGNREDWLLHTRAQMALPVLEGDNIAGVLDIQSRHEGAFDAGDVQALQIVAELLSTSLRNARLFEAQARTVQENQRLYESAQVNLREIQRLNQQLTGGAWESYVRRGETGVTLSENRLMEENDWTDVLLKAAQERQPVTHTVNTNSAVVAVPVLLRGEVIGAIEVEQDGSSTSDTVEMVEAVAQRLAISLENARLYEETTEAAAQEQRINDIAARYQEVNTVDELLRITIMELSQSLGAERAAIRLTRSQPEGQPDA